MAFLALMARTFGFSAKISIFCQDLVTKNYFYPTIFLLVTKNFIFYLIILVLSNLCFDKKISQKFYFN